MTRVPWRDSSWTMRIRLQPGPDTQLPLLGEIPEMRLARLEGNNGIGKTLSIRVLQLCTGRSPYLDEPLAWKSFRGKVGALTVTVSGIRDVGEIQWKLHPARFDTDALTEPEEDWFEIAIDKKRGSLAEVRELLGVERLAGDQGLTETFSQQVAADEAGVAARLLPLVAAEHSPLAEVVTMFDEAIETARRVDGPTLLNKRKAAARAKSRLDAAREVLRERTSREQLLRETWELQMRLRERDRVGAGLERELQQLAAELTDLNRSLSGVREEIREAETVAGRSEAAKRVITNAKKREKRRSEEVNQLRADLTRLRVIADVPENVTGSNLKSQLRQEIADLRERYVAIDSVPLMRRLTDELVRALTAAEAQGLGKQSLLEGGASVSELRGRLEQKRDSLKSVSPSTEGAALTARISSLQERLEAVDELLEVSEALAKSAGFLKKAREEIEAATQAADPEANERLQELRRRAAGLDAEIQDVSSRRTALLAMANQAAAGATQQQMRARLKTALRDLDLTPAALESELSAQAVQMREAEIEFSDAEDAERTANREARGLERDFERAVAILIGESHFDWLHPAIADRLRSPEVELELRLTALGSFVDRLGRAAERANGLRSQVQGVQQALRAIKETLRRSQNGGPESNYHPGLVRGYEAEFTDVFADPRVSELLLGQGARVHEVSLHPDELSVTFADAQGRAHVQPLEAFSRGQQAFAYIRARLATLDALGSRPRERLVVLDEFGAFLARDRLGELTELLADRVRTTPGEQILLVLPASTDYEGRAALADHDRADQLRGYADQLATHGFVFEELPVGTG